MAASEQRATIAVYETVDVSFMTAQADSIGLALFGLKSGVPSHDREFTVNRLTGYFRYRNNRVTLASGGTPQTAAAAERAANALLDELRYRLLLASQPPPKDGPTIPALFKQDELVIRGLVPLYEGSAKSVVGWRVTYGVEVASIKSGQSVGQRLPKAAIEGSALVLVMTGQTPPDKPHSIATLFSLDYNHLPISRERKPTPAFDGGAPESLVYKMTASALYAPYYLTNSGTVPASKESIALNDRTFQIGGAPPSTPRSEPGPYRPLITVSDVVHPTDTQPGSASILIAMRYRVVTEGEGVVIAELSPQQFAATFSKGNLPSVQFPPEITTDLYPKNNLYLRQIPEKGVIAVSVSDSEYKLADNWRLSGFTNFYQVKVKYDVSLDDRKAYDLISGLEWVLDYPHQTGLILSWPFAEDIPNVIKMELSEQKSFATTKAQAYVLAILLTRITRIRKGELNGRVIVLQGPVVGSVLSDAIVRQAVISAGATIKLEKDYSPRDGQPYYFNLWKTNFLDLCVKLVLLFRFSVSFNQLKGVDLTPAIGQHKAVAGINFIITNPRFFGIKHYEIASSSTTLVLAHEVGHNIIQRLDHPDPKNVDDRNAKYGYDRTGLQANLGGYVYPTLDNTLEILSDINNSESVETI